MSDTDTNALRRWATLRDAEAFKDIAARHGAMVYAVCRRILGNATEAEDAAQECFESLATTRDLSAVRSLGAWLHGAAVKLAPATNPRRTPPGSAGSHLCGPAPGCRRAPVG